MFHFTLEMVCDQHLSLWLADDFLKSTSCGLQYWSGFYRTFHRFRQHPHTVLWISAVTEPSHLHMKTTSRCLFSCDSLECIMNVLLGLCCVLFSRNKKAFQLPCMWFVDVLTNLQLWIDMPRNIIIILLLLLLLCIRFFRVGLGSAGAVASSAIKPKRGLFPVRCKGKGNAIGTLLERPHRPIYDMLFIKGGYLMKGKYIPDFPADW